MTGHRHTPPKKLCSLCFLCVSGFGFVFHSRSFAANAFGFFTQLAPHPEV
jgi:hypothetical protein